MQISGSQTGDRGPLGIRGAVSEPPQRGRVFLTNHLIELPMIGHLRT